MKHIQFLQILTAFIQSQEEVNALQNEVQGLKETLQNKVKEIKVEHESLKNENKALKEKIEGLQGSIVPLYEQHSGQFLIVNEKIRVSACSQGNRANEEPGVSALARKSVRTIV